MAAEGSAPLWPHCGWSRPSSFRSFGSHSACSGCLFTECTWSVWGWCCFIVLWVCVNWWDTPDHSQWYSVSWLFLLRQSLSDWIVGRSHIAWCLGVCGHPIYLWSWLNDIENGFDSHGAITHLIDNQHPIHNNWRVLMVKRSWFVALRKWLDLEGTAVVTGP